MLFSLKSCCYYVLPAFGEDDGDEDNFVIT